MPTQIFLTGITGYIGGDVFHTISAANLDVQFTALVRGPKADLVRRTCPNVDVITGELDDYELIKNAAAKADIVIHTADASDHEEAAKAIAEGLLEGHSATSPGHWIHTGGTGILTYEDSEAKRLGEWSDKEYNDWSGVNDLVTLPDSAFHRSVDKIVLAAGTEHKDVIKTAIVCPPTIYGKGRGPSMVRGRQVYELAKLVLTSECTPITGKGHARWNYIHLHDLSDAFLALTREAIAKNEDPELWGAKGYHLTEDGEHVWGDLSRSIANKALELKYISTAKDKSLDEQAALDQAGFEAVSWGLNSRAKALRLRSVLNWTPSRPSIFDEVENIVKEEHERLRN